MAYAKAIKYRKGFKYQLARTYSLLLPKGPLRPKQVIDRPFIFVSPSGVMQVKMGYAWDGPSGPVRDSRKTMRASLIHDALYQLLRAELLPKGSRKEADKIFRLVCREDGISSFLSGVWYRGLRWFGSRAASPREVKIMWSAP